MIMALSPLPPLLLGVVFLLLQMTGSMTTEDKGMQLEVDCCTVCLLLCDKTGHGPSDSQTLQEGLHEFSMPTRYQTYHDSKLQLQGAPSCQHSAADFKTMLTSIQRLLRFYEANLEQFNRRQDGGVGLVILKNQVADILEQKASVLSPSTTQALRWILDITNEVHPKIFEYSVQAEKDPVRLADINKLMNNPALLSSPSDWISYDRVNALAPSFATRLGHEKEVIYPSLDFQCLVALADDCSVPTVCQKLYLEEPYSQYMLLHQVLYLQVAQTRQCTERHAEAFGDWKALRDRLCAKAYAEADWLARHEYPVRFRDLFSEQVAFCGLAGYASFMRSDWLNEILSWQTKEPAPGCYPDIYGEKRTNDAVVYAVYTDDEGQEVVQDCLVHLSSVSLGAVAMNLRYIVDLCPDTLYA